MKCLAILGFFIVVQASSDVIKDSLKKIPMCVDELGLNLEETAAIIRQPELPEDNEEFTNFLSCLYTKAGYFKDGKLNKDAIKTASPMWLKFKYGEDIDAEKIAADVLELCGDAFNNESGVIGVIRLLNCGTNYINGLNLTVVNDI